MVRGQVKKKEPLLLLVSQMAKKQKKPNWILHLENTLTHKSKRTVSQQSKNDYFTQKIKIKK